MSASVLSLSWEKPGQVGSGIVGYRVEVREVQHVRPGSQELESVPLEPVYNREVKEMRTQVNQGLGNGNAILLSKLFYLHFTVCVCNFILRVYLDVSGSFPLMQWVLCPMTSLWKLSTSPAVETKCSNSVSQKKEVWQIC